VHDVNNPKHAAAHPDHPRTVTVREDILISQIRDFFDTRVFGPDRAALLAEQIPGNAAQAAEHHARQRDRLVKELARIDLAQRSQITQIDTLDPDPANTAAQAMRQRCYERFTELQADRDAIQGQLDAPDHAATRDDDTSLLDLIPLPTSTIALHPNTSKPPSTKPSTSKPSTKTTPARSPSSPPSPPAPPKPSPAS
jgi:hypothetical protein